MVNLLDGVVGQITEAFVSKAMWENTIMVLTSDNGGQAKWPNAAGANMPLRGGSQSTSKDTFRRLIGLL